MEQTKKPIATGIFSLAAGFIGLVFVALILINFDSVTGFGDNGDPDIYYCGTGAFVSFAFYTLLAIILFISSSIAIIGGIFALRRRTWGFVQAGSIFAIIAFFPAGIPSLILAIKSRKEIVEIRDSVTAGIVMLVPGLFWLLILMVILVISGVLFGLSGVWVGVLVGYEYMSYNMNIINLLKGILLIVCALLPILGGIFAMRRKLWWLVLAGSIATIFLFFPLCVPLGLPAIIFTVLARNEFGQAIREAPVSA